MEELVIDKKMSNSCWMNQLLRKKTLCNLMDTCLVNWFLNHRLVFLAMFWRTIQICNSWNLKAGSGNSLSTDIDVGSDRGVSEHTDQKVLEGQDP